MKLFPVLLMAVLVGILGAVAPAQGQIINEFEEGQQDNHWQTAENWSRNHPPLDTERAVIPEEEDCLIYSDGSDAVAESFQVCGTLTIGAGRSLTITESSTVGGELNILAAGTNLGELVISGADVEIGGGCGPEGRGYIVMQGGTITGGEDDHLTLWNGPHMNHLTLWGYGRIEVRLTNNIWIYADTSGETLYLSDYPKEGGSAVNTQWYVGQGRLQVDTEVSGSGKWSVYASGEIVINDECCVSGDVVVGTYSSFIVNDSFCTTGDLHWFLSTIRVKKGKTAAFGGECPGCS